VNKAHKSRFASKASRHAHKIDKVRSGKSETSHRAAVKGARAARIQQSKAIRDKKRAALLKEKRSSNGPSSAPRVIVLVGLSSLANAGSLAKDLLAFAEGGDGKLKSSTVASPTYKLRTTVLQAPYGDLTACMELAKPIHSTVVIRAVQLTILDLNACLYFGPWAYLVQPFSSVIFQRIVKVGRN